MPGGRRGADQHCHGHRELGETSVAALQHASTPPIATARRRRRPGAGPTEHRPCGPRRRCGTPPPCARGEHTRHRPRATCPVPSSVCPRGAPFVTSAYGDGAGVPCGFVDATTLWSWVARLIPARWLGAGFSRLRRLPPTPGGAGGLMLARRAFCVSPAVEATTAVGSPSGSASAAAS